MLKLLFNDTVVSQLLNFQDNEQVLFDGQSQALNLRLLMCLANEYLYVSQKDLSYVLVKAMGRPLLGLSRGRNNGSLKLHSSVARALWS